MRVMDRTTAATNCLPNCCGGRNALSGSAKPNVREGAFEAGDGLAPKYPTKYLDWKEEGIAWMDSAVWSKDKPPAGTTQ